MKKFSLLSGAYINAGDFLIVERTKNLLTSIYPDCQIIDYKRDESLDPYIDEINKSDALIIAGGPAYKEDMYPDTIKLTSDLDKIKVKIVPIGLGWYGKKANDEELFNYKFTDQTKKLLDRITSDVGQLPTRDWYTVQALNNNGYKNAILTGCPAWYHPEYSELEDPRMDNFEVKKITISDPAKETNFRDAELLVDLLIDKYPQAEIYFVFHRIDEENNKYNGLMDYVSNKGVKIVNITGSHDGFEIYNDSDLHIGFRVHAHIYNMSMRNTSILIEEDGRGTGVNDALGLMNLQAFSSRKAKTFSNKFLNKIMNKLNIWYVKHSKYEDKYFVNNVINYINIIENNHRSQYYTAYKSMVYYKKIMKKYIINSIGE